MDDDPDDSENAPVSTADYTDNRIDGMRDLEDFSRLTLSVQGLGDALKPKKDGTADLYIGLKWTTTGGTHPSIKLYEHVEVDGGTKYLTETATARVQLAHSPNNPRYAIRDQRYLAEDQETSLHSVVSDSDIFVLPSWLFGGFQAGNPIKRLLFEGCSAGKGQLKLVILKRDGANYTEIGDGPGVWLDLKNIKSMYERVKATADGAENIPYPYNHVGSDPVPTPAMGWTPDPNGFPFLPAAGESSTYIVFVHGWNMTYDRSTMYAETMFKRMWHRGYKGRFAAFRWPTFYGTTGMALIDAIRAYYNDSEYRAWRCGVSLKQYLDTLPNTYTLNIVAHSMGNIVVGSALEKGASISNYALLNAAVPAVCYDTSGNVLQGWSYVTPNNDPDLATVALSYEGRLANVSGNLVNFFLPADDALQAWELNNDSPLGSGRFPAIGFKPHQWEEGTLQTAGYRYQSTAPAGQKLRVVRMAGERLLTSPDEAMGFAVQSPSKTVGADGRTRGAIDDSVDMTAFGFGSVHSAEFLFTIQQTRDFYSTLLLKLGIAVQP